MSAATSPMGSGLVAGSQMQEIGQGHWNMGMTKEAVTGLQPGVVEGWVMGANGYNVNSSKNGHQGVSSLFRSRWHHLQCL